MIKYTISLMLQVFFVTKLKSEKKKKLNLQNPVLRSWDGL